VGVAVKQSLLCLVLLGLATPASAQERVLGLLSLPEVFGGGQCAHFDARSIQLHESPNDSFATATIQVDQNWSFAPHGGCEGLEVSVHKGKEKAELPTREYDYEMPAAIVLDHREGWFKIRLRQGSAWLKASVVDRFMPLADLFEEFTGLTAISESFTGRLSNVPGAANGPIMMRVAPNQPVRVLEIRESGGRHWVRVEVLSNSACTAAGDGPPQVVSEGWLPLHDQKGEPTVWFSSRGC
jgi:hypothetical protein